MELNKMNVHGNCVKDQVELQVTLDDDFNVPDVKPDIERIIRDHGQVRVKSVRVNGEKAELAGILEFSMLYDGGEPIVMRGTMEFNETVNLEHAGGNEKLVCRAEIEDLSVRAIHSRKVSVKAIVALHITTEIIQDENVPVGCNGPQNIQMRQSERNIAEIMVNAVDNFRIKESFDLPAGKPNVQELLWQDVDICAFDAQMGEDGLLVRGELVVFVLYRGEGDEGLMWHTMRGSFSGTVDISGSNPDMISYVRQQVAGCLVEVKPDFDGENRSIAVELELELDIRGYEEKKIQIMDDCYLPSGALSLTKHPVSLQHLLMRNNAKCRVNDRIAASENEQILQICNCTGKVRLDDITPVSEESGVQGLMASGVLFVNVLYTTAGVEVPIGTLRGNIPFQHLVELKGIGNTAPANTWGEHIQYEMMVTPEQLTATLTGGSEIEIKGTIGLDTICFERLQEEVIDDICEEEMDRSAFLAMPGMTGYVVQKNDTLWDIAKVHRTTMESIRAQNKLTSDNVNAGDRLVLVKCPLQ